MLRVLTIEETILVSGGMEDYDDDGGYGGGDFYGATAASGQDDPAVVGSDIVVVGQRESGMLNDWAETLDNWSGYTGMAAMVLGGAAAAQGGLDVPNDLGAAAVGIASGALWTTSQIMKGMAQIAQP